MRRPIFVYGTLRDPDVLGIALKGLEARLSPVPARLPGHVVLRAAGGPFPALRRREGGMAEGLLLAPMDDEIRDALDAFEGAFDFRLVEVEVETAAGPAAALVYDPGAGVEDTGEPWTLEDWQAKDKPLMLAVSREVALGGGGPSALRRALSRVRAGTEPGPEPVLGTDFGPGALTGHRVRRLYTGFFALEEHHYRHPLFGGGTSEEVRREVLVMGDAVTVLPWDPKSDRVLLIEQIRAGLIGRGDPNPWNIEVIAGLCDARESREDAARREAAEEAGIALGRMAEVARFYPSPGAVTEHVTCFIAEADLSGYAAGVHGLDGEHEDIRTLVLPRAEAVAAIASGEARNAPLIISLLALERERARLLAAWSGDVAAGGASD